jgi:hypothetical protein
LSHQLTAIEIAEVPIASARLPDGWIIQPSHFDHSNVISLLDSGGAVRLQQAGLGKKPDIFEQKILELVKGPKK